MEFLKRKQGNPEIRQVMENIAKVEQEIQEKIFRLGQSYYEENKNNKEIKPYFYNQIDLITKLDENRKNFYMNKLRLEGMTMCANCGEVVPYGSVFCSICGKKVDEVQEYDKSIEHSNVRRCVSCGTELEEGASFCEKCGRRIEEENNVL